jgi:hypothetical protein
MMAGDSFPQSMTPEQASAINPADGPDAVGDDPLTTARGCVFGLVVGVVAWSVLIVAVVGRAKGWF